MYNYILHWFGFEGVCVTFNYEFKRFKFSVVDNEFYLFSLFSRFNVSVYNVGYYLVV